MSTTTPAHPTQQFFRFENWFQLILDLRDAGYSQADIRFILNTTGVMDELRRIVEADNRARQATP